jgi:radical SAM protein (TIGR01212 family)
MQRYYTLARYLRQRFGERVQKIPLDAGASCPHRNAATSTGGCIFCNSRGSGSGLRQQGLGLAEQWEFWRERYQRKFKVSRFIAYLQSFSNTHGPLFRLKTVLDELARLPELAGLALGTRPDCLDAEKLSLIADFPAQELWLELGLQSAKDATLARINRGHDVATFIKATRQAAAVGLKVCAHLIAGLPGENKDDFMRSIALCNDLPLAGIKLHNLYVCDTSDLAALWRSGDYLPLARDAYVDWLVTALARLRPDIVVQRITADPAPGELLAPDWAADKTALRAAIHARLVSENIWQGRALAPEAPRPPWFDGDRLPFLKQ